MHAFVFFFLKILTNQTRRSMHGHVLFKKKMERAWAWGWAWAIGRPACELGRVDLARSYGVAWWGLW